MVFRFVLDIGLPEKNGWEVCREARVIGKDGFASIQLDKAETPANTQTL